MMHWNRFKGMSIPFPSFWIESEFESHHWGVLVETEEKEEGFLIQMCLVVGEPRPVLLGVGRIRTNKCGDLILHSDGLSLGLELSVAKAMKAPEGEAKGVASSIIHDALDTLLLLGCKNVGLEPRDNDPKEVRRAIKRHGGNADKYRYHVLVVRPPGAKSGTKGEEIGIMPRHVCRGHFSEYGPEFGKGLLFGKYAGRFYIPPHMKGKKENGEVAKDYQIGGAA